MLKPIAILASIIAATPCCAQEVRVITEGIEHVYGRGGQILDSPELRARNERAERRMRNERRDWPGSDQQRTVTIQTSRRQAPRSWWNEVRQQPPTSWWTDPAHQNPPKSTWADR